jgi:hypothetical protein
VNLPRKVLKGGALLYVVLLSLIVSALLGAYLFVNFYQQVLLNRYYFSSLAADNLESGMVRYLAEGFPLQTESEFALFGSAVDSCQIRSEHWGLFGLVHGRGVHGQARQERSCLVGRHLPPAMQFSLYLSDGRQPLVLIGHTRLEGRLFLPAAGLKTGYVGRRSYEGRQLHYGSRKNSRQATAYAPAPTPQLTSVWAILNQIEARAETGDQQVLTGAQIDQDWAGEVHEVRTLGSLELQASSMRGKCRLIAGGELRIGPDAALGHCLLFARRIVITQGFHGAIQAFATEAIEIEAGVKLAYPSVLMLSRGTAPGTLLIGENCQVEGLVMMERQRSQVKRETADYAYLAGGSVIRGQVSVPYNLDLQGSVFGPVVTDRFLLRTPGTSYQNHLLDAQISFDSLSPQYAAPLFQAGGPYKVLEWL